MEHLSQMLGGKVPLEWYPLLGLGLMILLQVGKKTPLTKASSSIVTRSSQLS